MGGGGSGAAPGILNGGGGSSSSASAAAAAAAAAASSKAAADAAAFVSNVATSVLIVFVNKVLMDPRKGYGFVFATTLCAFHFLSAAAAVSAAQAAGLASRGRMPFRDALGFAVIASVSIASLNVSLLVNSVGFYQVAKLLIIPFVCAVEAVWLGRRFPPRVVAAIAVVVMGVALVTLSEASLGGGKSAAAQAKLSEGRDGAGGGAGGGSSAAAAGAVGVFGLVVAAVSVATSGLQQILCGVVQRRHRLQSHELLAVTAPIQGAMLLVVGPFVDYWVSGGKSVLEYTPPAAMGGAAAGSVAAAAASSSSSPSYGAWFCLALSCLVAVGVNLSQFACLGRFSAVTFQVLGHTKTVLVLLASWLVMGESLSPRKALGMLLAVAGMVAYGALSSSSGPPAGAAAAAAAAASAAVGVGKARDSGGGLVGGGGGMGAGGGGGGVGSGVGGGSAGSGGSRTSTSGDPLLPVQDHLVTSTGVGGMMKRPPSGTF
jgi:solute carrier family 35, member E3